MRTVKTCKWINEEGKITKVIIYTEGNEEWIAIRGYNPFPFFTTTKFKTSKSVFENWMEENGFKKLIHVSDYHSICTWYSCK